MLPRLELTTIHFGKLDESRNYDLSSSEQVQWIAGRSDDVEIKLAGNSTSRKHARLTFERPTGCWYIEDLGSAHGTYFGDRRLTSYLKTPLKDGSTVTFGCPAEYQKKVPEKDRWKSGCDVAVLRLSEAMVRFTDEQLHSWPWVGEAEAPMPTIASPKIPPGTFEDPKCCDRDHQTNIEPSVVKPPGFETLRNSSRQFPCEVFSEPSVATAKVVLKRMPKNFLRKALLDELLRQIRIENDVLDVNCLSDDVDGCATVILHFADHSVAQRCANNFNWCSCFFSEAMSAQMVVDMSPTPTPTEQGAPCKNDERQQQHNFYSPKLDTYSPAYVNLSSTLPGGPKPVTIQAEGTAGRSKVDGGAGDHLRETEEERSTEIGDSDSSNKELEAMDSLRPEKNYNRAFLMRNVQCVQ
jgi:hypothetical protein